MPPEGQHEAGKHSRQGKKKAEERPRVPKSTKPAKSDKTTNTTGAVYSGKKKGVIRRFLGF